MMPRTFLRTVPSLSILSTDKNLILLLLIVEMLSDIHIIRREYNFNKSMQINLEILQ